MTIPTPITADPHDVAKEIWLLMWSALRGGAACQNDEQSAAFEKARKLAHDNLDLGAAIKVNDTTAAKGEQADGLRLVIPTGVLYEMSLRRDILFMLEQIQVENPDLHRNPGDEVRYLITPAERGRIMTDEQCEYIEYLRSKAEDRNDVEMDITVFNRIWPRKEKA